MTVGAFVDRLASAEPVPGGGSAAAVAGSLAAALVAMVAALSEGRPKYAEHAALHAEAAGSARALADQFLFLADEDAEAYAGFGAAMRLPRDSDLEREARSAAIRQAARSASDVPYRTVEACLEVVALAEALAGRSNRNASSDLEVAALLAVAASRAAAANVYVNLPSIEDEAASEELLVATDRLVSDIDRLASQARETVLGGEARPPIEAGRGDRPMTDEGPRLLLGAPIAAEIRATVARDIDAIRGRRGHAPALAVVIVGSDAPSAVYLNQILRSCEKVGIEGRLVEMPGRASSMALRSEIERLNRDPQVAGIIVQMPLPSGSRCRP